MGSDRADGPRFDGNAGFGWIYLAAVAVEVLPASAWVGYRIRRDWTRREGPWSPEATKEA